MTRNGVDVGRGMLGSGIRGRGGRVYATRRPSRRGYGRPMRVGLIGAGAIAARHAETLREAGARLVAVADVDRAAASRLAAPWDAAVHLDWQQLLGREQLDV